MIKVKELYMKFIREYYALYDVNFEIEKGEHVAFVGNKHSGRTTMLRIIAGLESFDSGEVYINDRDIKTIDFSSDIELGYIPEVPVFFEKKTVYENLQYVLSERNLNNTEIETRINQALINFQIERYKDIKVKDLNLFEKFLISFIRLTLRDIKILLIDNIFEKLEEDEIDAFIDLIKNVFLKKDITMIVVSDTFERVKKICNRQIHFENGSIVE